MGDWALGTGQHTGECPNSQKKKKSENIQKMVLVTCSAGRTSSKEELLQREENINQETEGNHINY